MHPYNIIRIIIKVLLADRSALIAAPATTGSSQSTRQATAPAPTRPRLLGPAFPPLAKLALCPGYRPARDGHPMAPEGIQTVLEMEIEAWQTWATAHRTQDP